MMSNNDKNEIREYLLGRVTDTNALEKIEERLFSDDAFCSEVEIVEEELVHDYVFGKLDLKDRDDFEEKIAGNPESKFKIEMAVALKQKAREEATVETSLGFMHSVRYFFSRPLYAGGFAVLLVAVILAGFLALNRRGDTQLAELKNIYQKGRPVEPRISGFDYAPLDTTRGGETDDANKNRLLLIESKLLEAVVSSPTAENHHYLGVFRLTQRQFDDAVKELSKAAELYDKNAKFHNDLGSAYFALAQNGNKDKSTENLARANEEFTKATELDPTLLEALFNRSLTLQELHLSQEAKRSWNLYLEKDASSKWAVEARKHLSELEARQTGVKKKEDILPDMIAAFRNGDNKTLWNIHAQTKGKFTSGTSDGQLTAAYLKAKNDPDDGDAEEILSVLSRIGELEEKNGDFFFARLAEFYAKLEGPNIEKMLNAKKVSAEGFKFLYANKAVNAIEQFEKSKKLFLELNDTPEAFIMDLWVSQSLVEADRINESYVRLNALIDSSDRMNFKAMVPTIYYWIATGEGSQQKLSRSIKSFQKAIKKADELSAIYEMRHSGQELADAYVRMGEPEKALNYYDNVIDKTGMYAEAAQTYRNLLTFAGAFGKLELNTTAADFARESVQINNENKSLWKTNLVNGSFRELTSALAKKGQFDEALKFANESNEIALSGEENTTIAFTYLSRADLKYLMNNCADALADYDRSLEFYIKSPETTHDLYNVHKGKLLCFQALGKQAEFDIEFETVRELSEEYRQNIREDDSRQAFFDSEQVVFDAAVENALEQNDSRKAFEFVEQARARSLLDFVKSERSVLEVENDFSAIAKPLSLEEIQARLPEDVQAVQYAVLSKKLAIWTITKQKTEYSENQISAADIEKKISIYVKAIREKASAGELRPAARELFDALLPKDLEAGKTICLIPDKSLQRVPFASLVSGAGKFLIEDFPIVYSPSASILALASENAAQKEKLTAEHLLSVGNPDFDREEYPGLAGLTQAEEEVKEIAKDYPGAKEFTGNEATKENFLASIDNADVIHFAGHFVANEDNPGYSKLLFAGDALVSSDLAQKHLTKAKLVVLSACQTGLERNNRSEGAIGLARAFLAAGSPLVLASNWMVDSEATKDLMIAFHGNRKRSGQTSSESLRQAQLDLLKKDSTRAPYYWSAFNLIGGFTNY